MARSSTALWSAWITSRDEAAFETLVRPALPATYHLARRMGLGDADAEDVVQEALSQLAQTRSPTPGDVGIGAWLMRTVRLRSLMSRRSARRRARREQQPRPAGDQRGGVAAFDVQDEVERALDLLRDDDRQVLVFRFLYDLSYREISYVLGVSENACRIRVHRASERLRTKLGTRAPTLLAAIPLAGLPDAAHAIAAATQSAVGTSLGTSFLGGLVVNTGLKMAASAAVAALVTAGAFMTAGDFGGPDADREVDSVDMGAAATGDGDVAKEPELRTAAAPQLRGRAGFGGTGVVQGRITTPEGTGVGGVVVVATPRFSLGGSGSAGEAPVEQDLEEEIRKAIAATHARVTGARRTTTKADGSYRLTGLGDAQHRIAAYKRGWRLRAARGHPAYAAVAGSTVDFTAEAIVGLTARIEGIDQASGGRVGLLRARTKDALSRAGLYPWSTERPTLALEPGTWWVQAVQGPDRELASEPQELTLVAGQEPPVLTFRLTGHPGLRGSVEIEDGSEPRRLGVYAMLLAEAEVPRAWVPQTSQGVLRGRYDRRDGTYSFSEIGPGRYLVGVTLGGQAATGLAAVEVTDRMVDHVIKARLDMARYVVVHVTGPGGAPVPEGKLDISTAYKSARASMAGGGEVLRRKDGAWLVAQHVRVPAPIDKDGNRDPGRYSMRIIYRGMGTRHLTYDPTSREELRVQFSESCSLAVTLSGLDGSPLLTGAQLQLFSELPGDHLTLSQVRATRAGEVFTFSNIQAGARTLALVFVDPATRAGMRLIVVDARPVQIRAGSNAITWRVPALHTFQVQPPQGQKYVRFGLVRLDPAGNWMQQYAGSKAEGEPAVFEHVPAGRYELVGTVGQEEKRIPVQVPGDKVILLD